MAGINPRVLEYLPVPLHIKHDNPLDSRSFATEFSLAPLGTRHVDLLTGPITAEFPVAFMIEHTVVDVKVPLQPAKYRLTVEASARDAPPVEAFFEAWIDESGSLQCIQL